MSTDLRGAFVRGFVLPVAAAVGIVCLYKAWRPERFAAVEQKLTGKTFKAAPVETLPVFGRVPDFSLTRENGETVSNSNLRGRIWIADFIFTRCSGICPLMSNKMKALVRQLENEPGVRFVSFSVDPEYDTPDVLTKYARRFEAPAGRWFFLTGRKDEIFKIANQHFYLGASDIPEEEREVRDQPVRHSSKFALVDGRGRIRGYYDTESPNASESLLRDVRVLMEEN